MEDRNVKKAITQKGYGKSSARKRAARSVSKKRRLVSKKVLRNELDI